MRKIAGVLFVLAFMCQPITSYAADAVFERTHQVNEFLLEDAQLLMQVAQAEAGNQGITGQWLVMCVILNRVDSEEFPNTIEEVISQDGQFATYANGAIEKAEPTSDTHLALAYLESGERAKQIVAFESVNDSSLEKYFWRAFSFRDHCFYTSKK